MSKTFRVGWRQTATDDLYRLYDWIADRADPDTLAAEECCDMTAYVVG